MDFYRGWEDYAIGFGEPEGDYWLGLRYIHAVTDTQPQQLRVNVTDFDLGDRYAKYGIFNVSSEADKFRLSIGAFSGNAGKYLWFALCVAQTDMWEERKGRVGRYKMTVVVR